MDIANRAVLVKPSIDTIEIGCQIPPKGIRKDIQRVLGREIPSKPMRDKTGFNRGVRFAINQPTLEVLPVLNRYRRERGIYTHQVDITFDHHYRDEDEATLAEDYLSQHLVLKNRSRRAQRLVYDNQASVYWCRGARKWNRWTQKWDAIRLARDLIVYRKSRKVVRVELKFQKASAVRRAGLADPEKLVDVDPSKIFERNLKLVTMKEGFIDKVVRRAVKKDRERHLRNRGNLATRTGFDYDRYRADLPNRLRGIFMNSNMQGFFVSGVRKIEIDWIGTELFWPEGGIDIAR